MVDTLPSSTSARVTHTHAHIRAFHCQFPPRSRVSIAERNEEKSEISRSKMEEFAMRLDLSWKVNPRGETELSTLKPIASTEIEARREGGGGGRKRGRRRKRRGTPTPR